LFHEHFNNHRAWGILKHKGFIDWLEESLLFASFWIRSVEHFAYQ